MNLDHIDPADQQVLTGLNGTPRTVSEIAVHSKMGPGAVLGALSRLTDAGLVESGTNTWWTIPSRRTITVLTEVTFEEYPGHERPAAELAREGATRMQQAVRHGIPVDPVVITVTGREGILPDKDELATLADAADSWAQELIDYIAPTSDAFNDAESAENQRGEADAIRAAISHITEGK